MGSWHIPMSGTAGKDGPPMIPANDSSGPPAEEPPHLPPLALRRRSRDVLGSAPLGEPARYALHALADVLALFFPMVLAITRGRLSPAADVIALLAAMVVIALAGGLV